MKHQNCGEMLVWLREKKKAIQSDICHHTRISRSSLYAYETGARIPPEHVWERLMDYFGVKDNSYGKT